MQRVILAGLTVALAWVGKAGAQVIPATAAVSRTVAGFAEDWNRHDMVAFASLFARDADFVNVGGTWWRGRASIQEHHAYSHGTIAATDSVGAGGHARYYGIFRHSTITFDSTEVRLLRPDVALARVAWHLTGDARISGRRTGRLLFVLVRTGEAWRITAAQNTEISRTVH